MKEKKSKEQKEETKHVPNSASRVPRKQGCYLLVQSHEYHVSYKTCPDGTANKFLKGPIQKFQDRGQKEGRGKN